MSELRKLIESGLAVRAKLDSTGRSRANLGTLPHKVAYWVAASKNVEKTALLRRNEILIVLPPNFVGKFQEMINKIEEK